MCTELRHTATWAIMTKLLRTAKLQFRKTHSTVRLMEDLGKTQRPIGTNWIFFCRLAYFSLGQYADAVEQYRKGLDLEPNSTSLKQSLSAAEKKLNEVAFTVLFLLNAAD